MLAAEAVVVVGVDYKYTLDWTNRDLKEGDPIDEQMRLERKSQLHKRSADRMREMLRKNGGIYIKLVGDHDLGLSSLLTRSVASKRHAKRSSDPHPTQIDISF